MRELMISTTIRTPQLGHEINVESRKGDTRERTSRRPQGLGLALNEPSQDERQYRILTAMQLNWLRVRTLVRHCLNLLREFLLTSTVNIWRMASLTRKFELKLSTQPRFTSSIGNPMSRCSSPFTVNELHSKCSVHAPNMTN